ncbi:MAG: dipeptidyl-peptidase 4 [Acidimicrobiaceae bacterium]|nr:dipeptidyl-peptidase 4 [Acidimicrobiaceae bacterium]
MTDSFPRRYARTQRFTLGEPRTITVSPDGRRVVFVRSRGGEDPVNCLWLLDVATGDERLVADPRRLDGGDAADLPPAERARRERAREGAGGVVDYATDRDVLVAAFALGGRLFVAGLLSAAARQVDVVGPVFDPRPDPTARRVAYVCGPSLRVAELDGTSRSLVDGDEQVSWGSAEFVASEEMDRARGYWWAPDGESLAVARVDNKPVKRWWIADPAHPESAPTSMPYPAAGTDNAVVTLHLLGLDGHRVDVEWDHAAFPYLASVAWIDDGPLLVTLVSRDQHDLEVRSVDVHTGSTTTVFADHDEAWVDLVDGTPRWLYGDRLVMCAARYGARRLLVNDHPVSPADIDVRAVVGAGDGRVVFTATAHAESTEQHVWTWTEADGAACLTEDRGVHSAVVGGSTIVTRSATLDSDRSLTRVHEGPVVASNAMVPVETPNITLMRAGERQAACALVLPRGHDGSSPLPVLLDPYGGPHAQRVLSARAAYLSSQWFADQGFAVVIVDGRGTPGRGAAWERAVHLDLAGPVLDDQVSALLHLAGRYSFLDLTRVGIRGWSFGGYLAALAVLRRPDIFHAAVAGAPVTDWRLYDTYYTERYLGVPTVDDGPYERCSLLSEAGRLTRPLLLIHGLADDNVVAANTLQFSSALLAAGRPHQVLPLSGVSHMTPQEIVAENLLLLQLSFLRESLGIAH